MTTTIVNDTAGLTAALKSAQSGDIIQLAAGSYSPVAISGLKFEGGLTITSADPNNMATLSKLTIKNSEGLTFRNLEFQVDPAGATNPYQVSSSNNITFDHLNVHGSLDGNPINDVAAMIIRSSTNVSVTNSEFHELQFGITHLEMTGLNISRNYFHDIRTDGIRGGGSSNVTIADNYFTDFHPGEGDHPDAIQFWTTNTTHSATDITVTGNVVLRGSGEAIQGVFFRDQVGNLPYNHVVVSDNLVVGGMYNGIALGGVDDGLVSGNVVAGLPDQRSWLSTIGAHDVTLVNNSATYYQIPQTSDLVPTGNSAIDSPADGGKAVQQAWLAGQVGSLSGSLQGTFLAKLAAAVLHNVLNATTLTVSNLDDAAAAALKSIEEARAHVINLVGTSGADRLSADGLHDMYIDGGAGNDLLTGGGLGHNTLLGGAGDDTYYVKSAFDVLVEAQDGGQDLAVTYVDFTLPDHVENMRMMSGATYGAGNDLDNKITGTADADEIRGGGGADLLQGMAGDDQIYGGDGDDVLSGMEGNDTLVGDDGNDKLNGSEGNDSMSGGAGADTLEGGVGADTMSGGAGADQFFFRNGDLSMDPDVITDFNPAEGDKISVSMIDANVNVAGDQKFSFIGTAAFSRVAGQLRYDVVDGQAHVQFDVNGDGVADMQLFVGKGTLQSSDFVL